MKSRYFYYLIVLVYVSCLVACEKKEEIRQPLYIGQNYQGGKIVFLDSTGQHGLIASVKDLYDSTLSLPYLTWMPGFSNILPNPITTYILTGSKDSTIGTGISNTLKIIAAHGDGNYAAKRCYDLELNGYSDWYLPSKDELFQLYLHKDKFENFATDQHWTSTESSNLTAYFLYTSDGTSDWFGMKTIGMRVRPFRSF
jgi:hypothetical protein